MSIRESNNQQHPSIKVSKKMTMTAVDTIHGSELSVNTGILEQRISSQFQMYIYGMCLNRVGRMTVKTLENKNENQHSYNNPNPLFHSDLEQQKKDDYSLNGGEEFHMPIHVINK